MQGVRSDSAQHVAVNIDRGKRRVTVLSKPGAVEPSHGNIFRNATAALQESLYHADRGEIVHRDGRRRSWVQLSDRESCLQSNFEAQVSSENWSRLQSQFAHRVFVCVLPHGV